MLFEHIKTLHFFKDELLKPGEANSIIKKWLKVNGYKQERVAELMHRKQESINRTLNKKNVDCNFVIELSKVTKHDFFQDFSNRLQGESRREHIEYDNAPRDRSAGALSMVAEEVVQYLKKHPEELKKLVDPKAPKGD